MMTYDDPLPRLIDDDDDDVCMYAAHSSALAWGRGEVCGPGPGRHPGLGVPAGHYDADDPSVGGAYPAPAQGGTQRHDRRARQQSQR